MIEESDRIISESIWKADTASRLRIPFYESLVAAGFPSPADNYIERVCDLNQLVIPHPDATYFVRVGSDSMEGDHICQGDVLVVDSSLTPILGSVVVVWLSGNHAVKRLQKAGEMVVLLSSNPKYVPIYVHPGDDFRIFGVVTYVFHPVPLKP